MIKARRYSHIALALYCALTLSACVNQTVKSTSVPAINTPDVPREEALLLDVGIVVFDPGLDEYEEGQQVYPEVRKAESRYMPNLLSDAMVQSGAWGAVRVIPTIDQLTDLRVEGTILKSDGETLSLAIQATDSRNYVWLEKTYTSHASRYAYQAATRANQDAFQAMYNTIANDLLAQQQKLRDLDRKNIRLVTELRFAQSFSSDTFAGYLGTNKADEYIVLRLPAEDDPMLMRVENIRERDLMFVDTLQAYLKDFNEEMYAPYQEWRKNSYDEAIALAEVRAESTRRMIAGGLAILAGIAGATSDDSYGRAAGNVAIIGGGYLLKSGLEKRAEAEIHVQALEEMGMSLEAEVSPSVIAVEDRTVTLSGNVEEQYQQWRELLSDIYRVEIGALELPTSDGLPSAANTSNN